MTKLPLAKKKYADKMKTRGPVWKKRVTGKEEVYAKAVADFLGIPSISTEKKELYKAGIDRVSAEDFAKAVEGKEEKWARRLIEAFSP
jgi:hypothetical protein